MNEVPESIIVEGDTIGIKMHHVFENASNTH